MLFGTHPWIELLNDGPKGKLVAGLMEQEQPAIATPSLSELTSWAFRNELDAKSILEKVKEASLVLPLTEEVAQLAGELHFLYKKETPGWGMVDSMIYATALTHGLKLVSGDKHFKGKQNVVFL